MTLASATYITSNSLVRWGGGTIPYDPAVKLNSITMVSAARLPGGKSQQQVKPAPPPTKVVPAHTTRATQPKQHSTTLVNTCTTAGALPTEKALLGFSPKSTSHIEHMSASRASELLHRRSHMGHAKIKALPHACADAPKLLSSAQPCTCPHCAQANIKKASHSGSLDTPADRPGKLHVDLKASVVVHVYSTKYRTPNIVHQEPII